MSTDSIEGNFNAHQETTSLTTLFTGEHPGMDDDMKAMAAEIFVRITAGRILRDGTTGAHALHDASASLDAAEAFAERLNFVNQRSQPERRVTPYDQRLHRWTGVERRIAHRR
jgi:hypothetical protein